MNRRLAILLLLAASSASGLAADPPPAGRTYNPGAFDSLSFDGSAAVQFRQGERDEVFVEGDDELQRTIRLELHGGTLSIRTPGGWRFWASQQRLKVRIQMRELKSLQVSGAVDFVAPEPVEARSLRISISGAALARFERLKAEELRFTVSGSGDGHFSGSVDELHLNISGRSDFFGENLAARNARVAISGLGKVKVWVSGELSGNVSGIGTIDYWGGPSVQRRSAGISSFNDMGPKPMPRPAP